jgi:hypothetical protein
MPCLRLGPNRMGVCLGLLAYLSYLSVDGRQQDHLVSLSADIIQGSLDPVTRGRSL